jgi:hypothetical protein
MELLGMQKVWERSIEQVRNEDGKKLLQGSMKLLTRQFQEEKKATRKELMDFK